MKKYYLLIVSMIVAQQGSAQFASQHISLLSQFDDAAVVAEPQYGIRYQSCVGWADTLTGKEYGIIGSTTGTYIIEVTDPAVPVQRDYVSTRQSNIIWHEYKTFGKYLYIISDGPSNNQLQICDMSYLPDSVHVVYDSNALLRRAHTISIDGNKMYLGSVTSTTYHSMQVFSLNNPELPVLLRSLDQDYSAINQVHDMYVVHDTVYASCGSQGLHIYRYDSVANAFSELGTLTTYPEQGYNHSSVLSEDHSTLYMCDETSGKAVKVVDVTAINAPSVDTIFRSHVGAIAHNPYVKGDYLYIAYYLDGVYVYNISNPRIPVLAGFFDTHPQNGNTFPPNTYQGCWAVYTDLPSGTLLAADMQYGLFCLDATGVTSVNPLHGSGRDAVSLYPNPASDILKIKLPLIKPDDCVRIEMTDAWGRKTKEITTPVFTNGEVLIHLDGFSSGLYLVKVYAADHTYVRKVNVVR